MGSAFVFVGLSFVLIEWFNNSEQIKKIKLKISMYKDDSNNKNYLYLT